MDKKQHEAFSTQKSEYSVTGLVAYLEGNDVWYNLIEKESTLHTAEAATRTGIPLERITKSLVFLDSEENPIMVIVLGNCKVDATKLGEILKVKDIRLAPFKKANEYSGYEPGATPPVHHKKIKKVVIDTRVMQFDTVFGGGGSRKKLIELRTADIQKLNNATVVEIAEVK